jgi:hypothetical protein
VVEFQVALAATSLTTAAVPLPNERNNLWRNRRPSVANRLIRTASTHAARRRARDLADIIDTASLRPEFRQQLVRVLGGLEAADH